jgi:hypothetical protein
VEAIVFLDGVPVRLNLEPVPIVYEVYRSVSIWIDGELAVNHYRDLFGSGDEYTVQGLCPIHGESYLANGTNGTDGTVVFDSVEDSKEFRIYNLGNSTIRSLYARLLHNPSFTVTQPERNLLHRRIFPFRYRDSVSVTVTPGEGLAPGLHFAYLIFEGCAHDNCDVATCRYRFIAYSIRLEIYIETPPIEKCPDCNEYPCECPSKCPDCNEYPCECPSKCPDCNEHPCVCPPLPVPPCCCDTPPYLPLPGPPIIPPPAPALRPERPSFNGMFGNLWDLLLRRMPTAQLDLRRGDTIIVPIGSEDIYRKQWMAVNGDIVNESTRGINMDTVAYIDRATDSTMIPIRFIGYALDMEVIWDPETRIGTIDPHGRNLQFEIGSRYMRLDGRSVPVLNSRGEHLSSTLVDGRMFVPLRSIGVAFGLTPEWDDETRTAYLHVSQPIPSNSLSARLALAAAAAAAQPRFAD